MELLALLPLFSLIGFIIPIVLIVMAITHSKRISALEKEVAALKGIKGAMPVAAQASVRASSPAPAVDMPMSPASSAPTEAASAQHIATPAASGEDSSGRILGRIGIGAVLIGVAFFLKYAFDENWIGPVGRVMIGIIIGLGFLGVGQYLRAKYLRYSDLLMGGGIAILYLSIFAARSFYNLTDSVETSILMFVVTLLAFAVSIYNATQTLSVVSVVGAFWTPFLVGFQSGDMMTLFGYMLLINIGVLAISFFKKWLRLNIASFAGTLIVFLAWFSYYTPDVLGPTLVFCVLTFIIFLIAQIARSIVAGVVADGADYFLMGASAFWFAAILYTILNPAYHSVLGFVSVVVALVYIGFAFIVNRANPGDTALNIFLPALSVIFLSIAVPMQFSGPWIAVAWFVESCALYGMASVIGNRGFQVMGLLVYVLGLLDFFSWYASRSSEHPFSPFFNAPFGMFLLAIAAAYGIAYIYHRYGSIAIDIQKRGIVAFLVIANVLSLWALSMQVTSYYADQAYQMENARSQEFAQAQRYSNGYDNRYQIAQSEQVYQDGISHNNNMSNTLVSILWTIYAAALTAIGFIRRLPSMRRFGLVLFLVTAFKVLIDVWSIGELYRIISFIGFGIIALAASFGYVKYKDRLKGVLSIAALIAVSAAGFLGLSFGATQTARAAFAPTDWKYTRPIDAPSTAGFVKMSLPSDISWGPTADQPYSDIRIIDGQGNETPYMLQRSMSTTGPVSSATLIDLVTQPDGSKSFIADFGQSGIVHTNLDLVIGATPTDFKRQVSVYSFDKNIAAGDGRWNLVTSNGFIFRISDPSTGAVSGKYSIAFPAVSTRYLKVVIASGQEGPVSVVSASAYRDAQVTSTSAASAYSASIFNDPKKKTTDVTIDLGISGRLSSSATLNIGSSDTNYIRRVSVSASDSASSSWNYIGDGTISRVSTSIFSGSSNVVSYPETRARYIRLSIINDDNQPLSVASSVVIGSPVLAVVFQVRSGSSYALYYGNPSARQPEYDITGLSSYIDQGSLPFASVGPESLNSAYSAPEAPVAPYTESHAWVLNAVLALLVIIVGIGVGFYLRAYTKGHSGKGF